MNWPDTYTLRIKALLVIVSVFCISLFSRSFAQPPVISAGSYHDLFIDSHGDAWAMGYNDFGQLGDGTEATRYKPVFIMSDVVAASAGDQHSLFLKSDGTAWGCGNNGIGQLGDDSLENHPTPILIMHDVQAISAGYECSLFLKTDGTVYGCGDNTRNCLGIYKEYTSTPVPILSGVKSMVCDFDHSFFLKSDGTVWGCGLNNDYQLGVGTGNDRFYSPARILDAVTSFSTCSAQSLFLREDGSAWGCGFIPSDAIGSHSEDRPIRILEDVSEVSCGKIWGRFRGWFVFSLFRKNDGSLWGFGANSAGQIGTSDQSYVNKLTLIDKDVAAVSAGETHTLILKKNGHAILFGSLGQDTDASFQTDINLNPVPVLETLPSDMWLREGTSLTIEIKASSETPMRYQWFRDEQPVGDDSAILNLPGVTLSESGSYTCEVSNDYGSTTSTTTHVWIVDQGLAVREDPAPQSATLGSAVTFHVVATSASAISYQWLKNGEPIPNATSDALTITAVSADDSGLYSCSVYNNDKELKSDKALLTIYFPPHAESTSGNVTLHPGEQTTLSITASGTAPLSYQWKKNGVPMANATGSSLNLSGLNYLDEASYTCLVSNPYGQDTSPSITLDLQLDSSSPDSDNDGWSDSLETYLSPFGMDPATDSTEAWQLFSLAPEFIWFYGKDFYEQLYPETPILSKESDGLFHLHLQLEQSSDLVNWSPVAPLDAHAATDSGSVELLLSPDPASHRAFYRIESQPDSEP